LMLAAADAGADDIVDESEVWRVTTSPGDLHDVRARLEESGIPVDWSEVTLMPTATVPVDDSDAAKRVLRLIDALDEHDDVGAVFANYEVPDAVLEAVEAP
jgi:transcriptional/translational regulatory protein YebC/TACO1